MPAQNGYNGYIVGEPDLVGVDADLFTIDHVDGKENVFEIKRRYNGTGIYDLSRTYELSLDLVLSTGIELTSPKLKFKVTQGKMSGIFNPNTEEIGAGGVATGVLTMYHKYGKLNPSGTFDPSTDGRVVQANQQNFLKYSGYAMDDGNAWDLLFNATSAQRGKTYSIKMQVIQNGQAKQKGVLKPTNVTFKVKIAK